MVSPSLSAADIVPTVVPSDEFSFIDDSDWFEIVGTKLSVTFTVIGKTTIESESCPNS